MNRQSITLLMSMTLTAASFALDTPRMRPSPYFGNLLGTDYTDIENLGEHSYDGSSRENNALVYTARAGYIDLGHLRESADRARYLFEVCRMNLMENRTQFDFKVVEPAEYHVTIQYPPDWQRRELNDRYQIIREISIDLGQYFAHQSTIWHEIVTWFGYASTGLFSEKASSFSWEDGYSDLLGTKLAAQVLRENTLPYDQAMTDAITRELSGLDPQSSDVAKKATDRIQGEWFSGRYPFLSMNKRNFDVGLDDGSITPFRVPGICPGVPEAACTVPSLDALSRHGFTVRWELTPRESERRKVLEIAHAPHDKDRLVPEEHFPILIRHIRNEAVREAGRYVDKPTL